MTPVKPVKPSSTITSPYGIRTDPFSGVQKMHNGTDFGGVLNDPIYSVMKGTVIFASFHSELGNYIFIQHADEPLFSGYAHTNEMLVSQGQPVTQGQQIAKMGTTGSSTGVHLHFILSDGTQSPFGVYKDSTAYLEGSSSGGTDLTPIISNNYLSKAEMLNNANIIYTYLTGKGWTKEAISGMLGNMETESTINSGLWESQQEGNTSGGLGLVQWTPATKIIDYANEKGKPITDIYVQLDRIEWETTNNVQWVSTSQYPMSFSEFKVSTETPTYLADVFLKNYERALVGSQPIRGTQAEYWYSVIVLGNVDGGGTNPPTKKKSDLIDLLLVGALHGFIY